MTTLTKRINGIKMGRKAIRAIECWYEENNKDMPENWRMKDPEWWGDPEVIECSSGTLKPNGMVREDWHFENADLISAFIAE